MWYISVIYFRPCFRLLSYFKIHPCSHKNVGQFTCYKSLSSVEIFLDCNISLHAFFCKGRKRCLYFASYVLQSRRCYIYYYENPRGIVAYNRRMGFRVLRWFLLQKLAIFGIENVYCIFIAFLDCTRYTILVRYIIYIYCQNLILGLYTYLAEDNLEIQTKSSIVIVIWYETKVFTSNTLINVVLKMFSVFYRTYFPQTETLQKEKKYGFFNIFHWWFAPIGQRVMLHSL